MVLEDIAEDHGPVFRETPPSGTSLRGRKDSVDLLVLNVHPEISTEQFECCSHLSGLGFHIRCKHAVPSAASAIRELVALEHLT